MSTLKANTLLEEQDKLFMETVFLVVLDQIFEVIWEDNNLQTAHVGSTELLGSNACEAHFFPDFRNICFLSSLECSLILLQFNENLSKFVVVSNMLIENLGSFVKFVVEASITTLENVCLIWFTNESLKFRQISLSALSICKDEL